MDEWLLDKYRAYRYPENETISPRNYGSCRKISREEVDQLNARPHIKAVRILGLEQDTFNYFIRCYGSQFEAINFWKCPLVADFSKLSELPNLKYVEFFWNQRAERLWDMRLNRSLRGISISDFSRLHNLDDLATAPNLEELHFGDAIWDGFILNSLKFLQHCNNLRYLRFSAKKIQDCDLTPLASMQLLEELVFKDSLFTTEQVAWLAAKLSAVKSEELAPYRITEPIEWKTAKGVKHKDTFIIGKGKPFLDSKLDRLRIDKYEQQFYALVEHYKNNPQEPCPAQ